ncbi:MAG: C69 family dipeptidase, partial [Candidatus Cryptobacteroides sp.]
MKYRAILAAAMVASLFFAAGNRSEACTNVIVTRGASADGSCLVSYAADSHWLYGELYFKPQADWADGTKLKVYNWDSGKYLGEIEQVPHTYKTVGNMNEHQLIIAETTFGGRHGLDNPDARMDYGSLIYITLQRARTAREAIKLMDELTQKYGYFSEGESFSIADKEEAWIMEMVGKGKEKGSVWV